MSIAQSKPYTILELLTEKEVNYQIPVYQRNYAWGRPQIHALIQDVYDYYLKSQNNPENYYIGSLVVAKKNHYFEGLGGQQRLTNKDHYFEVLDGQQRFTTLNLLALFLKSKLLNSRLDQFNCIRLKFES